MAELSRRAVTFGTLAALVMPRPAAALNQCPAAGMPPNICSAMLDPARFGSTGTAALQEESQWCWAACIEMVCRFHGIKLSQRSIVHRVYGGLVNMPADDKTLTAALNNQWTSDDGKSFRISADVYSPALLQSGVSNERAIEDLTNERPLINGSGSHATVVARIDYVPQAGAPPVVERVHVIDPFPGAAAPPQYARFLSPKEMVPATLGGELRYVASIRIS